jgi:serine/threonine protein kinase/tetratricopeptide (TPR) repeat protein
MSSDTSQAKEIFLAAVERYPAGPWQNYLDGVCAGDAAVREEVETLLRAHAGTDSLFDQTGVEVTAVLDETACPVGPDRWVGPYRLVELLGEGGMGLVFLAEQEHPVRRLVALKLIKPGMDTRQVIARFEAERRALALMDHPNVARVLDAGETAAGRPYFVMELARGAPITGYCDDNRLPLRERLGLFVSICRAVQHAHAKGIIHRDLKPSNVLVALRDGAPVVKVIDFGIAKAVGQSLTDSTVCTYTGQLVGTPLYASPEQAGSAGLDVDTRSDVYSLGALLYELLTGSPPFDRARFHGAGYDEICRIIRDEEPPRPSDRVAAPRPDAAAVCGHRQSDPRKLAGQLRGELDWIVMQCLDKDRERRYQTANGLATDVERYLRDEPVQACPPSAWYQTRKFVRRHRTSLAVTCAALLLLLLGGGGFGWAARDRVAQQAALEREVIRALNEADRFQSQSQYPDALAATKRAEGLAAAGASQQLRQRVRDRRADLEMVGRVDDLRMRPFEVKGGDDDYAWVDRAYAAAFREYGIDVEQLPPEEAAARIRSCTIPTELAVALDYWVEARRRARADDPSVERLVQIARAVDPDDWRNRLRAAAWARDREALKGLACAAGAKSIPASSQVYLGFILEAMGERESAVRILGAAQARHPDDFWVNYYLGRCQGWLRVPDWDESVRCFAMALALRPRHAVPHGALGWALLNQGSLEPCVAVLRRAVELDDEYFDAHVLLAQALTRTGKWDEALSHHRRSLALRPRDLWAHRNLSNTYFRAGQPDKAIASLEDAVRFWPDHLDVRHQLARALTNQGKCDRALVHYTAAIDLCRDSANLNQLRRERALLGARRGAWAEAAATYAEMLKQHPEMLEGQFAVSCYCDQAFLSLLAGDGDGHRRVCLVLLDPIERHPDPRNAYHAARVGVLSSQAGIDPNRLVRQAELSLNRNRPHPCYPHVLGLALYRAGRFDEALRRLRESVRTETSWPARPLNWVALSLVYHRLGKTDEARTYQAKFRDWMARSADSPRYGWGGFPLHPHDWMECLILAREADALLGQPDSPKK